jgi:hypothetical protein
MTLRSTFTLLALSATLASTAQSRHAKQHFVPTHRHGAFAPAHRVQPYVATAAKSTATASRLIAVTSLEYDMDSVYFVLSDTAHITYSGQRGGDLNSEYIKFDNGLSWVNNGGTLENDGSFTQTFDGNDNILSQISQSWNGSAFENDYASFSSYDGSNNLLTQVEAYWNSGTSVWDSSYKYVYTYDLNNKLLTETGMSWDGSVWVNDYGYNYTLDMNGNVLVNTYSTWNTGTNVWDSMGKSIYTYNVNNLETQRTEQQWNTNVWENGWQYLSTYDLNNNLATYTQQSWNGTVWVVAGVTTNTYLNNDLVTSLEQDGMGANQINQVNTFDANHNMLTNIKQIWINNAFVNDYRVEYTYNSFDQATSEKESSWNGSTWDATSGNYWGRYYYENYTVTGVNDTKSSASDIVLSPVPARNFITVQKNWSDPQAFSVSITDMQGRLVRNYSEKATANYSRTIDVNQLPAGIYVIKVAGAHSKATYQQFSVIH